MNSQSWKRLFTPNIRSKPDNKIFIWGNKTIIRPKKRKDIENNETRDINLLGPHVVNVTSVP